MGAPSSPTLLATIRRRALWPLMTMLVAFVLAAPPMVVSEFRVGAVHVPAPVRIALALLGLVCSSVMLCALVARWYSAAPAIAVDGDDLIVWLGRRYRVPLANVARVGSVCKVGPDPPKGLSLGPHTWFGRRSFDVVLVRPYGWWLFTMQAIPVWDRFVNEDLDEVHRALRGVVHQQHEVDRS